MHYEVLHTHTVGANTEHNRFRHVHSMSVCTLAVKGLVTPPHAFYFSFGPSPLQVHTEDVKYVYVIMPQRKTRSITPIFL